MRTTLGQIITGVQRDAGALTTPDLRTRIQAELDTLGHDVARVHGLRPGADVMARIDVTSSFMATVITIALMVAELSTRPADQPLPVVINPN